MNILKSAIGHYEPTGKTEDAEVILGHSFGTSIHPKSPNGAIAQYILDHQDGQQIVVDQTLADAFPSSTRLDLIVEGEISNTIGSVGGTWSVLIKGKEYMDANELTNALIVAQKLHVGRVAMQAVKAGIENIIVPGDLPAILDIDSEQLFTRSEWLWVPREVLGSYILRLQHKL